MESAGAPRCRHGDGAPAVSAKKLWRAVQAVYLVVVKKHQPKLAALGVHLHQLLSSSRRDRRRRRSLAAAREEHPALTYLSSLSCRSMDPDAAVVHPYQRGRGHGRRRVSSRPAAPTLSCRSMDPAAAVCQYQYRPREVEFSCKSTPMHKRRRRERRLLRLQDRAAADQGRGHSSEPEYYYGSAVAVTRLFELMDVEEEAARATDLADYDGGADLDLEAKAAWPALTLGPAPRQVRITDSPYLLWDDDSEEGWGAVDRRADEFITSFYEQLRTQQPRSMTRNLAK
ncbi:uncharacterized protein C2845_PM05G31770 [Panicum miliaceum]|uniref:Uncharacterized protein n=1 Tax=Panicum miliaceum TaxID=4540 RepID=A0A3L6SW44_PANMI|nr:uncharacterized protein C2845_PM05G31770 [Panicum miliaceum]